MTTITRSSALRVGLLGVAAVLAMELFNGSTCYKHNLVSQLVALAFVAVGFYPGLSALRSESPIRAAGASLLFVPWLAYAYYVDCVLPYQGGGASMVYVAVVVLGLPSAALGAFLTVPVLKAFGVVVSDA
jgi:hypothetical protein